MLRQAESKSSAETSNTQTLATEPFDLNSFLKVWKEMMEAEASKKRASLAAALLLYAPEIKPDGTTVMIFVSNSAQKEFIEKYHLLRLISTARTMLNNSKLDIIIEVHPDPEGVVKGPFTPVEKGEHLLKGNEELVNLKKDLDLDIK